MSMLQEDEQFIRELALLSEGKESGDSTNDDGFIHDAMNNEKLPHNRSTVDGKDKKVAKKSGWGKGFLESRSNAKIKPTLATSNAIGINGKPSEFDDSNKSVVSPCSSSNLPVSGEKSSSRAVSREPVAPVAAAVSAGASTPFTGSIMERAPPTPTLNSISSSSAIKKEGASTGVILGPKKRS